MKPKFKQFSIQIKPTFGQHIANLRDLKINFKIKEPSRPFQTIAPLIHRMPTTLKLWNMIPQYLTENSTMIRLMTLPIKTHRGVGV